MLDGSQLPYVVIGGHTVNAWLEPRFTADVEDLIVMKLIANRLKGSDGPAGLAQLDALDWAYVERWAAEWDVTDRLRALRAGGLGSKR